MTLSTLRAFVELVLRARSNQYPQIRRALNDHLAREPATSSHRSSRPISEVLVGQKALVTGANSGIGRAVAVALGQAGADVVVNYVVGEDAAEQVVGEIRKCGSNAHAQKADVSQEDQVQEMFRSIVAQFGTVEIPSTTRDCSATRHSTR